MFVSLNYAARSDVGLVRSSNQDSGYAGPHLLVLADGMGGAAGGDIASSIAVAHMAGLDGESHGGDDLLDHLRDAALSAHRDLIAYSQDHPAAAGLGTTLIALLRSGSKLGMIHIGDSRAYFLRDGELSQVTKDHSLVGHLVETGQITPEEAEHHPQRSVVLRVLGDDPDKPEFDESIREARGGDRWLLCSDGLSSYVSHETITDVMTTIEDPGQCAERLIELALRAGGPDNVTVIVADVVESSKLPATMPQIVGAAATDRARPSRGGEGAAARAAALTRSPEDENSGPTLADYEAATRPKRHRLRLVTGVLVAIALILGASAIGYRWSQSQYFVGTDGTHVVIYQGISQQIGPVDLAKVHEVTAIKVEDLPAYVRTRLESTISADSLADAEDLVANFSAEVAPPANEDSKANKSEGNKKAGSHKKSSNKDSNGSDDSNGSGGSANTGNSSGGEG